MPNPSELERMRQENEDEMQCVSGTLNRDAFAYNLLTSQIEDQERQAARADAQVVKLRAELDRAKADACTARDRIASLRDTQSRLEKPHG